MQAVKTAFLSPGNVRGSRVKASCAAGSIILHWDHALNSDGNHAAAAKALATKLGWNYGRWIGGWVDTRTDTFCVWVCDAPGVDAFELAPDRASAA